MPKVNPEDAWVRLMVGDGAKFTVRDQELIIRHLAACSISCEKALRRELELAGVHANVPPFAGRIAYWRNCLQAAKLFAYRATTNQKTALALTPEEIQKVRDEWNHQTPT